MPDIGNETKLIVKETAQRMGYHSNIAARMLRTNRSKAIGVIVSDISNPVFAGMVKGIEYTCRRNGISSYLSLPRFSGNVPELIIEPGIHTSDLFLWLSGSRATRVYAESRNVLGKSFADTWMVVLKMENGVIGTMEQVFHMPEGNCRRNELKKMSDCIPLQQCPGMGILL